MTTKKRTWKPTGISHLDEPLQRMDNHMALANNAWATRQNYLRGVRSLMLHFNKRPEDCTVDELKAYLVHTRDVQQLSSSSVNLRVCGLKYYFREVVNRLDLVVSIPNPRHQKYFTEILSTQEVLRLFGACRDMRQLLVLQLIYETGMRVREVVRVRTADFDKHLRTITIHNSKGQKTRTVPYGDALRHSLRQYCKARGGVPPNTLVESIKEPGKPLSSRGVQYIVRDAVKRSGIRKRIHPHTLRHTFAVHYLNFGGTLPHELNGLCMHNPRFMYGLLLEAGWHTLNSFGSSPKWLGARTAATVVLHTWGQNLSLHPHIHCIVPSGGLGKDGKWQLPKRGNAGFLYPVAAMKKVFRAFFMQRLRSALEQGLLALPDGFPYKRRPYYRWKEALYRKEWVAYTKKPFAGPQKVVQYLSRYSHRIAITNHRILDIGQDTVRFAYKDYADGARKKEMVLAGTEFLRRFCLHILPAHFRKVRHYGLLANACKNKMLAQALAALANKKLQLSSRSQRRALAKQHLFSKAAGICPCCHKGQMITVETLEANKSPPAHLRPLLYG